MNLWKSIDSRVRITGLVVAAVAVAILAVVWWLASPLFINRTVNEAFPASIPAVTTKTNAVAGTDGMANDGAMAMSDAMTRTDAMTQDAMTTGSAMQEPEAMAKSDVPVALSTGSFTEVDSIHKGSGKATIYTLPDGMRVLRFEEFNVTNGPDLFVYLSGHEQPRSPGELHGQGDFDLGRLKGNVGSQNYDLPADLDLSKFKSVVIYCKQFSVVFSTATLSAA